MPLPVQRYNKGEWSELYAFIKLLKDGKIYAADENANRIADIYLPIIKLIRREADPTNDLDYFTGDVVRIQRNGTTLKTFPATDLNNVTRTLFDSIFTGADGTHSTGAFEIPDINIFMDDMFISSVKASSSEKVDIEMQIRDINTGYSPEVGFSIKSDVGSPPTLLNAGKNTRFRYKITGLSDYDMNFINGIDKNTCHEYIKSRIVELRDRCESITYDSVLNETYEDNLILIDSQLPRIYGEIILQHYLHIDESIYDCSRLLDLVAESNPINYRRNNIYSFKFKKLLTAAALGMTPGKEWDGIEAATGGYIIIKRDGDVLCYHLYNRNFFEEYLLNNTSFDRPSASRYDYGYVYKIGEEKYIDLNVQIRFKAIKPLDIHQQ